MLIDSHAHLDDRAFDEDREELILKLKEAGIEYVVNIAASLSSVKSSLTLAEQNDFIYSSVGVHPCETEELNEENFQWMEEQLSHPKAKAVGEIGLDYYWNEPEKEIQHKWFRRQLQLAHEVNLPIIIHSRDAAADTYRIMKEEGAGRLKGVIHCYSYTKETARDYLNWNYYFGIGGVSTFQNAKKLKEAVEYIPIENIVLETDSPYLAPIPYRGKRNSPLNLPIIARAVAEIKGMDVDKVIEITGKNSKKLYDLQ
ncbi:MAG: TatD family hydrolase [Lachnospiraceae bacterium]|nr:TatD family hydrolase [Lachnospiraceae bacterium]